jgi:opacity protein-like surface antigen
MKKHSLLLSFLAALMSVSAHASSNTYVGGMATLQDVTAAPSAYRGVRGGVFIGYGASDDRDFYVAGEVGASFVATVTNTYELSSQSLRPTPTLNISVLPAMLFSRDAMGFLRLGLAETLFTATNSWRPGVVVGLGLEAAFSPCWSVRSEYDYTMYRSGNVGTPRSDEFGVSLKYTFDV